MRGVRVFFAMQECTLEMCLFNKIKIRWKGILLEVCVVFNLSQILLL